MLFRVWSTGGAVVSCFFYRYISSSKIRNCSKFNMSAVSFEKLCSSERLAVCLWLTMIGIFVEKNNNIISTIEGGAAKKRIRCNNWEIIRYFPE